MIQPAFEILNQRGTPMFFSDVFANRPTAGIVGRIFISTNTYAFYRDTGTGWDLIGGPGTGTITGSGAANQVAFWDSASSITGENNLWWDATNNYLGINTNSPSVALDVHHGGTNGAILNQTTATNNNLIAFQTSGTGRWRIGNFYNAGADDYGIFDVIGSIQPFTIAKTSGQTFIGSKITASGRLVVNSASSDAHIQVVGANAPSIRIDNAGSGATQRFVVGLATATNNFIQGSTAGDICISTASASPLLFGMWQTINASEVMRISTSNNLILGSVVDNGNKFQVTGNVYIFGYTLFNTLTTKATANGVDISSGGLSFISGADNNTTTRTDSTTKLTRFGVVHYTNSEAPVCICTADSQSTVNTLNFGGGAGAMNTMQRITFNLGATNTTKSGTEVARFVNSNFLVGTNVDAGQKLQVAGMLNSGISYRAGTYTNGDTTPSVSGVSYLYIQNSGATSITNFTNAIANQIITLIFNDSNTTVTRNNAYLSGGLNFTSTARDTLTLIYDGTIWYEVCRSINS